MLVKQSGRSLAGKVRNFVNGNFFDYNTLKPIGWLISEGKILSERHEYKIWKGNPKGTLIVYKDGSVEVGLKLDSEIAPIVKDIWFCCQGFNLFPLDIKKEGFDPDEVGYSTKRLSIGYRKDDNKIIIAARPYSNAQRAVKTMKSLGCEASAICLDSGGSLNMVYDGKGKILTNRVLASIIYW
jgi:exopolysaccharide biosynthesis protein